MEKDKRQQLFAAALIPFATMVATGLVLGIGAPPARPVFPPPAVSRPAASSRVPSTEELYSSAASGFASSSSAPASSSAPMPEAFSFTNGDLLAFIQQEMGYDFLYHGSFQDQGLWADWIAMDTSQKQDSIYNGIRIITYARKEGGLAEAIRIEGSLHLFPGTVHQEDVLSLALRACAEPDEARKAHWTLDNYLKLNITYENSALRASKDRRNVYTLLAAGSSLDPATLDKLSPPFSLLCADRELLTQVVKMDDQYRHGELADLLTASFTEDERAQDTVLPLLIDAARRAAALEAECVIDRTIPSELLIYSQGATALGEQFCIVPRIQGDSLYLEAGFYAANDTPFTKLHISGNDQSARFSCDSNDISQLSLGHFFKSFSSFDASWYDFKYITQMEAPVARFSDDKDTRMYDHVLTSQEQDAFQQLYALWGIKGSLHTILRTCTWLSPA